MWWPLGPLYDISVIWWRLVCVYGGFWGGGSVRNWLRLTVFVCLCVWLPKRVLGWMCAYNGAGELGECCSRGDGFGLPVGVSDTEGGRGSKLRPEIDL